MNVGMAHPLRPGIFFGEQGPLSRIAPDGTLLDLWEAVGDGEAFWYKGLDEAFWGRWSTLLLVEDARRSQFDAMVEHLRGGGTLEDRIASVALSGRGFHGQRNRPWSVRRGNLHLVVHFSPRRPAREIGHGFTLLPAVAAVRTIRRLGEGARSTGLKWINDILVGERKVGGFLVSTSTLGGLFEDVVLGLGINIESAPEVEATPFVPAVGCLRDHVADVRLETLLPVLLQELQVLYDRLLREGPGPLMEAYREYALVIGQTVRVWPEMEANASIDRLRSLDPLARGVVTAIADDLSLIIEGYPEPLARGRLAEEKACRSLGLLDGKGETRRAD